MFAYCHKCRYPFLRVIQRGLQPSWSQARGFSPSQASHLRELAHCLLCLVSCIACPLVWFLISDFWQFPASFETNFWILVRSDSLLPSVLLAARLPGELPSGSPQPDAETGSMSVSTSKRTQRCPKRLRGYIHQCVPSSGHNEDCINRRIIVSYCINSLGSPTYMIYMQLCRYINACRNFGTKDCKNSFQVASRHRFLFQLGLPALLNLWILLFALYQSLPNHLEAG